MALTTLAKCGYHRDSQRGYKKSVGHCGGFLLDKVAAQVISQCFPSQFDDFLEC